MGTFKDYFPQRVKEKTNPELFASYQEALKAYEDKIEQFYGMISEEAREYFEIYIYTRLRSLFDLEKDHLLDFAFSELNNIWCEMLTGEADILKLIKESEEIFDV